MMQIGGEIMKYRFISFIFLIVACSSPNPTQKSPTPTTKPLITFPTQASKPSGGIDWSQARQHIGEITTVCGRVVDSAFASGTSGRPTFLHLGKPYPQSGRFTAIIWEDNRGKFSFAPESYYYGKEICVYGLVELYSGNAQIEVTSPTQITIR